LSKHFYKSTIIISVQVSPGGRFAARRARSAAQQRYSDALVSYAKVDLSREEYAKRWLVTTRKKSSEQPLNATWERFQLKLNFGSNKLKMRMINRKKLRCLILMINEFWLEILNAIRNLVLHSHINNWTELLFYVKDKFFSLNCRTMTRTSVRFIEWDLPWSIVKSGKYLFK